MPKDKSTDPTDNRINKKVMIIGAAGAILLAVLFFSLSFYFVRSRMKPQVVEEPHVQHAYTPPQATEPEPQAQPESTPSLNVEIKEHQNTEPTAPEETAPEAVQQDENGLTIQLEPEKDQTATQEPAPETHASRAQADAYSYRVQAGTYANRESAEDLVANLASKGYKADIRKAQIEDRTLYQVSLGTYRSKSEADKLSDKLRGDGYSPAVLRSDRN